MATAKYTAGARIARQSVAHQINYGISKLSGYTRSDEYVALDIARRTLEAIAAGDDPLESAQTAVNHWLDIKT